MRKSILRLLTLVTLLLSGVACGVLEEPPTPSAPLEAVPLDQSDATAEPDPAVEESDSGVDEADADVDEGAGIEEAPAGDDATDPTDAGQEEVASDGEQRIYTIQPGSSRVRFELDEDLRGQRTTVVGVSDQVAGEIGLNLDDLSLAEVGVIRINARTLTTDNNFRNRAIQNEILDTGAFEFITFTPTAINGLPANVEVGQEVSFDIVGELTIRDVTQPVTFDVVATAISPEELMGTARTTVSREAFGLAIPEVRNVANVEDEVDLYIDFAATA